MDREKWMDNWNKLRESTCKTAEDVGTIARAGAAKAVETAQNVAAYGRLKVAVAEQKAEVNRRLRAIGEMVYATHTGAPTDSDTMEEALLAIDELKSQIAAKEKEMQAIRGVRVCQTCGWANDAENAFCSNCGQPMGRD